MPHPLLRFRLPAVLLGLVILYGIGGYTLIEGWNLLDAFYMTIITISTVGYSELHSLSTAGRLFTSTLIVVGVGTMLYGFGVFAETLTDGAFVKYRRERQLERALNQLTDHFIICGYGRIGTQIVAEFEEHKVPYAVIDQTEEALVRLRNEDRLHVEGDASSEEVLKLAGIARARGLISPYQMAGHRMAELAVRPALVDVLDTLHHGMSEIAVEEMLVKEGMAAVGKTISDAGLLSPQAAKLLALRRDDGTVHVNPGADMRLEEGDLLIALGSEDQLYASAAMLK